MKLSSGRLFALFFVIALISLRSADADSRLSVQQKQSPCPVVKVICPDSFKEGEALVLKVEVRGGDPNVTPTFNWTLSAGTIASGQGTARIEIDTTEVSAEGTVTATVDVAGFSRECPTYASCTADMIKKIEARKLDEYSLLKPQEEETRLDRFVIELNSDPTAQGYIISYGGRKSFGGDAMKAATKAKKYLATKHGLDDSRVVIIDGGYREQPTIELWIVPSGALPPEPTPAVRKDEPRLTKPKKP